MSRKLCRMILLGATLGVGFLPPAVQGEDLNGRIQAMEEELTRLKEQQVELKKEATAAAAALPTFEYRPGNGLNIEAGDKSWGLRATIETHFRYLFESGRDQQGRTQGELMGRRFRPRMYYCINNCLWEIEAILDMDGFGTGNAKNSLNTATSSILQRGEVELPRREVKSLVADGAVRYGRIGNSCSRLTIQDLGNGGRQALFDTGANSVGDGLATLLMSGLTWETGPYTLRLAGGFQSFADRGGTTGKKRGNMFLIGHDLFLWSPKGFLTGSATTPGSILFGTHFERTNASEQY